VKDIIFESLKGIQRLVNLYFIYIGFVVLIFLINLREPSNENLIKLPFFNLEIQPNILSLIYGLFFGLFIILTFLKIRLLYSTIEVAKRDKKGDYKNILDSVRLFPWIASPFHQSKLGKIFFNFGILFGFVLLGFFAYAHIKLIGYSPGTNMSIFRYRIIGWMDVFIFILGLFFLRFIFKYICKIRDMI